MSQLTHGHLRLFTHSADVMRAVFLCISCVNHGVIFCYADAGVRWCRWWCSECSQLQLNYRSLHPPQCLFGVYWWLCVFVSCKVRCDGLG